jgi:hypothetical protein
MDCYKEYLEIEPTSNRIKLNSQKFPFNILLHQQSLLKSFKDKLDKNLDALLVIKDDSHEIMRKKSNLFSAKLESTETWFINLGKFLKDYENDSNLFDTFEMRCQPNEEKIWSELIENMYAQLTDTSFHIQTEKPDKKTVTFQGTKSKIAEIKYIFEKEIQKLKESRTLKFIFNSRSDYWLFKHQDLYLNAYRKKVPNSGLSIEFGSEKINGFTLNFKGNSKDIDIGLEIKDQLLNKITKKYYLIETSISEFILSFPESEVLELLFGNSFKNQPITINLVDSTISSGVSNLKEVANFNQNSLKLLEIKSIDINFIDQCYELIKNFDTHIYNLDDASADLITSRNNKKFTLFFSDLKQSLKISDEELNKVLRVDLQKRQIR